MHSGHLCQESTVVVTGFQGQEPPREGRLDLILGIQEEKVLCFKFHLLQPTLQEFWIDFTAVVLIFYLDHGYTCGLE